MAFFGIELEAPDSIVIFRPPEPVSNPSIAWLECSNFTCPSYWGKTRFPAQKK
jgi:hypothetical protein